MQKALEKLLTMGAIIYCEECPIQYLSPVFLTPKSDNTFRFILNLKSFNKFIRPQHFKMEDLRTATQLLSEGYFMATIDLKDAYFLIPIHPSHRAYLRFRLDNLYEFTCLPFGLCSAPYVFTKLIKPILSILRSKGHRLVAYLDDFLCIGENYSTCLNTVNAVVNILHELGFVLNYEKSNMEPSENCKFLGIFLNSRNMTLELPKDKRDKILKLTEKISKKSQVKIREFAKFIGTLTAACPAVKYGWLHTKAFERQKYLALLRHRQNYEAKIKLSSSLQPEFDWWKNNILVTNNPIRKGHYDLEIFTDSSLSGWGAFCENQTFYGHWSEEERENNINYLELLAAFLGLKSFCNDQRNIDILLRIDNTTAISYINRMGGIQLVHLNSVARQIWDWCEHRNIFIFASYIKSKDNVEADKASRITNMDTEWDLNHSAFLRITETFGLPDIDLFATRINKKCNRYVSWKRDPEAFDIDAFTLRWNHHNFYAFPPFSLVMKCLRKIVNDKATGILVVPYWPSQAWYPMFMSLVCSEILYFEPNIQLLLSPSRTCHPLWRSLTLACARLSGKHSFDSPSRTKP